MIIDVIGTNKAKYISSTLKNAFESNGSLEEVLLLKGGRMIIIKRSMVGKKNFRKEVEKEWNRNK